MTTRILRTGSLIAVFLVLLPIVIAPVAAQDRIKTMPGYEQYMEMNKVRQEAYVSGAINARWADDSKSFEYSYDSKRFQFDVGDLSAEEIETEDGPSAGRRRGPDRGHSGINQYRMMKFFIQNLVMYPAETAKETTL